MHLVSIRPGRRRVPRPGRRERAGQAQRRGGAHDRVRQGDLQEQGRVPVLPQVGRLGDQGYGGNALSLRATQLTLEQLAEVVKCGRPGTGMPYHDRFAYTDKRCYGYTRDEMGKDMPPAGNDFLSNREIDAVVKYLF